MGRRRDLLSIIEAAYDLDAKEDAWLAKLAESVRANVPFRTVGVVVNGYDISDASRADLALNGVAQAADDLERLDACWRGLAAFYEHDPARIRATYGTLDQGLGLDARAPGNDRLVAFLRTLKLGDVYGVNARNPSGQGCLIGIYLPEGFAPIPDATRRMFGRIARHLAAAYRLRRRAPQTGALDGGLPGVDAVLATDGTIEEAAGAARTAEAREALRRSAEALAVARGRKRFEDPDEAIAAWKALVDARWSLVDHFERDGSHYLVARRNDCKVAPMATLTHRERQVAALAAMGYSNKEIAYDLGIATSTVGVLVSRALARLGLRSRRELRALQ
jgi:DNA-binding NarL/FixJ family response regulator